MAAQLSARFADRIVFIGRTALARTHLRDNSNLMVVGTQRSLIAKDTASPRHWHPRRVVFDPSKYAEFVKSGYFRRVGPDSHCC